jgi:DNA-binding MarR family transcriptional regulator
LTGHHTLIETELAVSSKLHTIPLDFEAMAAVSNIYRASTAIRNHLERSVLHENDLTWTAFVVMWVVWIWERPQTNQVAEEVGISKGTLTGVIKTLEARGLLGRQEHANDRRLVLVELTAEGDRLMTRLFPRFNAEEAFVVGPLNSRQCAGLAQSLRTITTHVESGGIDRQTSVRADAAAAMRRRKRAT